MFIFAQQEGLENVPGGDLIKKAVNEEGEVRGITDIKEAVDKTQNSDENYLSNKLKEFLLQNSFISKMDSFFSRYSLIFRILFGVPYEFSLAMLFILIFFIAVFFGLPKIVSYIEIFDNFSKWVVSLLIAIILAQVQFFRVIAEFFERLFFAPENGLIRIVLFIIIILIIILIYILESYLGSYLKKLKEGEDKDKTKSAGKELVNLSKGIKEKL